MVLISAVASALLVPATGVAQTSDVDPDLLEVDSVTFEGVESIDAAALKRVLATQASSWLPWAEPRYFNPEEFDLDLRRVVAFYHDRGYPDVSVVSHEVRVDQENQTVDVVIRVEEGEPVLVSGIVFEGVDVLEQSDRESLRGHLAVAVGDVAAEQPMLQGVEQVAAALENQGFAYADVSLERVEVEPKRLRLAYVADAGPRALFGPIEVEGNASVDDTIVRRQLAYRPGDLFRLDAVRESQQKVYGLELFQFAVVQPIEDGEPVDVPTRVTVAEGDHRRLMFSVGWGTEEKARGEAAWRHVNFYGGARTLAARGKLSSLDSGAELDFRQPYFFTSRVALSLNGHSWFADELAYRALSQGGRIGFDGRLTTNTTWSTAYTYEVTSTRISAAALSDPTLRDTLIALGLDPTSGERDGILSAVSVALQHNTTNNRLDPRSGYAVSVGLERAGSFLPGDYNYTSGSLDARGYLPLGSRFVLAGRLYAAVIDPVGDDDDVPFFKRYFLGGSTSLRGWGRFEVSPLSGSGLPLGGFSLLQTSLEVRTTVWGRAGLAFFVDAGDVRNDVSRLFRDLKWDVGPGLRYLTPVGPLRVDFAYQLTPIEGLVVDGEESDRRWRIHFSIGQSF
ncbi:MAG: outer membrane protein assembly factor [Vicinamibacterales bacterium]